MKINSLALLCLLVPESQQIKIESISIPACNSIECLTDTAAKNYGKLPPDHPKDYMVPNFGLDHDIIVS